MKGDVLFYSLVGKPKTAFLMGVVVAVDDDDGDAGDDGDKDDVRWRQNSEQEQDSIIKVTAKPVARRRPL